MRLALTRVPPTLEQTYGEILARIPKDEISIAKKALFWLTFSAREMAFHELCEAVVIDDDDDLIQDDISDLRLLHPQNLLRTCGSLISYNQATTSIALAHSSVWLYLTSRAITISEVRYFHLDIARSDNEIATTCIRYLCLPAFRSGYCLSEVDFDWRCQNWPLFIYSAKQLFFRLLHIQLDDRMRTLLLKFFATYDEPRGGWFGAWVQGAFPSTTIVLESATPLYYAARYGLLDVVRLILEVEGTKNLEKPAGVCLSTPLHVAAWKGQTEVVRELLKAGANAREVNGDGIPGLLWAVKYGDEDVERLLRDAGAKFDDPRVLDETIHNWDETKTVKWLDPIRKGNVDASFPYLSCQEILRMLCNFLVAKYRNQDINQLVSWLMCGHFRNNHSMVGIKALPCVPFCCFLPRAGNPQRIQFWAKQVIWTVLLTETLLLIRSGGEPQFSMGSNMKETTLRL